MRVSHVAVDDFRSYRHAVLELDPGATVLLGPNGQGKTNLVEAIAFLSTFSSHRVAAEGALVRIPAGEGEAAPGGAVIRVKAVLSGGREQVVELEIVRGKANRARLNRTQVRPREVVGLVRTVVFAPEDLSLVRADPAVRRTFMDELAIQLSPVVAGVKADFDKVARQRAALLKQAQSALRRGRTPELSTLSVWDERFAELSAKLTAARAKAVRLLAEPARLAHDTVADSGRSLRMVFEASLDKELPQPHIAPDADPLEDVEVQTGRMLEALRLVGDREVERGVNLVGAHRDDLGLHLGHMPVKGYASHGESWSVALALRLGAFEVLKQDGEQPILVLDDVFAELDTARRRALAEVVRDADQVLVTAAVEQDVPESLGARVRRVRFDPDHGSMVLEADDGH
ncbi:DNA replication/repair protein RecF [Schaalia sp. 19OD2882]|uniref:DNA replication/repair protein RecF n=1 Tax=Schaalia sp. 19OD2882 TaxID=2794089 RepID=UPI001C1E99E7|nr:DNA replication/repair protein RecF [Schaalia sp. 19OD2882]QWW19578.1 DNA replication/repair protein RecF [Schaalia sp. 19OD2882]